MTNPQSGFVGGALDLSQVKAQAEAREAAKNQSASATPTGGIAPFFDVTDANFENEVVRRSTQVPVIAIIGTQRSPASEQLKADFKELADAAGLKFTFTTLMQIPSRRLHRSLAFSSCQPSLRLALPAVDQL